MLPFMIPMLLGAGAGALLNRKDPLKGALIGAAGGAIAPGLGSMFGGAAGGAVAGAPASLANVALPGAGTAGFNAAGAAIDAGMGQGMVGMAHKAGGLFGNGVGQGIGLLDKVSTFAKPVMQGVQTAQQMMPPEQQFQMPAPPPSIPQGGPNLTGLLELGEQRRTYDDQVAELRRQKQQAAVNRMMG